MKGAAAYAAQARQQDDLVTQHAPLVKRIAYHLLTRLPPSVLADDLIQSGMIGLLEAARHYDPAQGATFETYAGIRIRGAMLDEIRKSDWTPRSVHRKAREVAEAVRKVEHEKGRDARDHEVAEAMGLPVEEYHRILRDASGARIFSFDDPDAVGENAEEVAGEHEAEPLHRLHDEDFQHNLARAIGGLPERERLVMSLYYEQELNLREIGAVLGVSESRVCQIHGQALTRLRARLADWMDGD